MAITVHKAAPRRPSSSEQLGMAFSKAAELTSDHLYSKQQEKEKESKAEKIRDQENDIALEKFGVDLSGTRDPVARRELLLEGLKQKGKKTESDSKLFQNREIISDLEKRRQLQPGSLKAYENNPAMGEQVSRPKKEERPTKTPFGEKEVPVEISRKIKKIIIDNPNANADELKLEMDEQGIPPSNSNPYIENRRRTEEQGAKSQESKQAALRAETLPIRKQIADKALAASHGIQNKEQLIDLIEKGNIDDPTFAALAEALPLNLGKRMLSNDTVEYKAGLVEEFGDLRNIFQGQTRIKEIELLENKIADLYLTDEQKKSVLKSRINALKGDMIRAEVAQEIENEPYGVLQFSQEVEKRAKPKLEALFNQILDEQKSIIQNAENKKKTGLDINDPDDKQILLQIFKESGNDKVKARKLAEKKGYKF